MPIFVLLESLLRQDQFGFAECIFEQAGLHYAQERISYITVRQADNRGREIGVRFEISLMLGQKGEGLFCLFFSMEYCCPQDLHDRILWCRFYQSFKSKERTRAVAYGVLGESLYSRKFRNIILILKRRKHFLSLSHGNLSTQLEDSGRNQVFSWEWGSVEVNYELKLTLIKCVLNIQQLYGNLSDKTFDESSTARALTSFRWKRIHLSEVPKELKD